MDLAECLGCGSSECSRSVIKRLRDTAQAGIDAARGNGEETRRIGIDQGGPAADENEAGGYAKPVTHGLVNKPVETTERDQHANSNDRAGAAYPTVERR